MNTPRFILPAVVAAAFHGALFLYLPEKRVANPVSPDDGIIGCALGPVPDQPVAPVEPAEDAVVAAAPRPLPARPSLPDLEMPRDARRADFTVPVSATFAAFETTSLVPRLTGRPDGLEGGDESWLQSVPLPDAGALDRMPRAVFRRSPAYPESARREGADGSVTVEFIVDTEGQVIRAEATQWSRRDFVEPAVRAVRDWRFEPGTMKGRKVKFRIAVPIEFVHHPD